MYETEKSCMSGSFYFGGKMYRTQRNYENVQRMLFNGIGEYDIPQIESIQFNNAEFIGFIMPEMQKNQRTKQCISSWMITSLPEYGQNRTDTFQCCSDSSTC